MDLVRTKADLRHDLDRTRNALLFKADGLSDYDVRRPLVPTGTNLLGLIKHCAHVEAVYFQTAFGRPFDPLPALDADAEPNLDMYATADESRADIIALYERACAAGDRTIEELDLDAPADVSWWPEDARHTDLLRLVVHVIVEANRHAGQADIVRELIDGSAGFSRDFTGLPDFDATEWPRYVETLEGIATQFR
jgi:Protein of unknown function (DUF664)